MARRSEVIGPPCIRGILNAGKISKLSFKIFLAGSYLLYMSTKRTSTGKIKIGRTNRGQENIWEGHGLPKPP